MVTIHLTYHLILLRLMPNCLRVSRTTCVDKGVFSLDFLEIPLAFPSLETSSLFSSIVTFILPLYFRFPFSFPWLDCWGKCRGDEGGCRRSMVQGSGVCPSDLATSYFLNPCSSRRRLSFSVEEWDSNSMVINPFVGHRIPWKLKKALDWLLRKACRRLLAQCA